MNNWFDFLIACASLHTCESCLTANIGFECHWCDAVSRCSDGYDRQRQEWIVKNCEILVKNASCGSNITTTTVTPNISSSTQTLTSPGI